MVVNKSKSAFRTIAEVAEELGIGTHVLRFWETKFSQIKPMKRSGGRRYYRPDDVEILHLIKDLLYDQRYTIEGVQKLFKEKGVKGLVGKTIQEDFFVPFPAGDELGNSRRLLCGINAQLQKIKQNLEKVLQNS